MRNSRMSVRVFVASKHGFNPKSVRPGPEFKCFQCGDWFDGNTWRYTFAKHWYPFLKYPINFLCSPRCSSKASEEHKDKYVGP